MKIEAGFSKQSQIEEMWALRRRGETIESMAEQLGRSSNTIYGWLRKRGGIAPAARKRSALQLSLAEREEISRGLAQGLSLRRIALRLDRQPSTVAREVARNGGSACYRAVQADESAFERAERPKVCNLALRPRLAETVAEKLSLRWSPVQIALWLKATYPHDQQMQASHETIYRTLYIQARAALKKELLSHLRGGHALRRPKKLAARDWNAIPGMVNISERPAEASDRAVPGHWEGDLIAGSNNSHIITLVERRSRYVMLLQTEGKDTDSVIGALIENAQRLPDELMKTLTWDQGREMADHARFTVATDVKVFFCDPRSPWQRGTNENTNGLLRQFFPKGTDLSIHTQHYLDYVAHLMNGRPRKTLGVRTPAQVLNDTVSGQIQVLH